MACENTVATDVRRLITIKTLEFESNQIDE